MLDKRIRQRLRHIDSAERASSTPSSEGAREAAVARELDEQVARAAVRGALRPPPPPPPRGPLQELAPGRVVEREEGSLYLIEEHPARAPVQMGDELWFYYGGWVGAHNDPNAHAAIGVATLRLDGFCSMHAESEEGWFISRVEQFLVPKVTINAKVGQGGRIVAEILDRNDKVIPGFSRDDCVPFTGDSVRHVLTWRTSTLPEDQRKSPKKFRFYLRSADIYSYLPDQSREPETVIWDPAANGGLLPDSEKIPADQRFARTGDASGYVMAGDGLPWVDLHSAAELKTTAAYRREADWSDDDDWCVEAWLRVVDQGNEPDYGLSVWFRPDHGRNAAIYLREDEVGVQSSAGLTDHRVLKKVKMDTTDRFHWYRLVHEGGASGSVKLYVDGAEVIAMPFTELFMRVGRGGNVMFGPNAGHREGRMHVAKFGYRTGGSEVLLGPVP
ncbi:MAG: hypothetical protein J7M38_06370 [Armatimonadetes bacterium]|nr:hypothetical protein [Armatimonadota bacterium]